MTLSPADFTLLRDFVYDTTGIYFEENRQLLLEGRLQNRVLELGLGSFEDYYYFLKYGDKDKRELNNLFEVISTNETHFFRHPQQMEKLLTIVRDEFLQGRNPGSPLRIWSAGCSTGEEAYTMAVMLLELGETLGEAVPFHIVGTDLSRNALASARRAVYHAHSVRHVSPGLRDKYFTCDQGRFALREEAKEQVAFDYMNLNDVESYRQYTCMDLILCRNVLIYFGEQMKWKVVDGLYGAMRAGGYLALGSSESLGHLSKLLKPVLSPGALIYRKEGT
jgi:chemotaxis protein methyltransferase CheR